ncbi:MAG: OmpA family protein [Gammaproteobacteria bacterium]|nr:OmpA family protein [Gammaproteobacteria bacterium]
MSKVINTNNTPAWMVTFADLMALMMTFFVLLYSFSKIDEDKYKSIVDSMAKGFDGVQWIKRRLIEDDIIGPDPGIIAPPVISKPEPKPEPEPEPDIAEKPIVQENSVEVSQKPVPPEPPEPNQVLLDQLNQGLEKEIAKGLMHVEQQGNKVVIRFPEDVSFTSGSDQLVKNFVPVIHRISTILHNSKGKITIAGHTDDRPISTKRFRSNWELSSSRAVSVTHRLLETQQIDKKQITVVGHADTQPLVPNTSNEQRAKNRRVEISIFKAKIIK